MVLALQIGLIMLLWMICWQDCRERQVYLLYFMAAGLLFVSINLQTRHGLEYLFSTALNLLLVLSMVLVLWAWIKLVRKNALRSSIGSGDLLFFVLLCLGLPSYEFIILFCFSLVFSLVTYLLIKSKLSEKTVPLAGFQALFFSVMLPLYWWNLIQPFKTLLS